MDELSPATVDIFISALSQVQGARSGPIGRITDIKNGLATHCDPGRGLPRRIKVKQRNGFRSLTQNGHSSITGSTSNPSWTNPEMLTAIGNQLLSIANAIPRVYDGTDWTHYAEERVVTNILSESIFHTSQRILAADDSATIGAVTMSVWSERPNPEIANAIVYGGVRNNDGVWIRSPFIIYDPITLGDGIIPQARVIADESGLYFWVVYNRLVSSADKFRATLFDLNGKQVDFEDVDRNQVISGDLAFWDITPIVDGGCYLAQPQHPTQDATDGVTFVQFTQTAGAISQATTNNPDIHCRGKLAWLTNDLGDENYYLATLGLGEEPSGKIWGYQIVAPDGNPFGHEFSFQIQPAVDTEVDSLIGAAVAGVDPGEPTLIISFTSLHTPDSAASAGPPFDPQLRYSEVWQCTWGDVVTFHRQNDYTCQVSRAFKHDDEYYSLNYYQSGSGNLISSTKVTPDLAGGDYMIGAKLQPVTVTANVDSTAGSPKSYIVTSSGLNIITSSSQGSFAITSPDKVENGFTYNGVPALKWSLSNLSATLLVIGSRLVIAGSSIPSANETWDILGTDGGTNAFVFTLTTNIHGGSVVPGTFSVAGGQTGEVTAMTFYSVPNIGLDYDQETKDFLFGGTASVSANATPANNGDKTILRTFVGVDSTYNPFQYGQGFWIETGSETDSGSGFSVTLTPNFANDFTFNAQTFDNALTVGPHTLIVENDSFVVTSQRFSAGVIVVETPASNNTPAGNGYDIVDVPSSHVIEVDATVITAEVFRPPLPKFTIRVPDDVTPYTFFIASLDPDYTYQGATLIVTGATTNPDNNGVYTITGFDTAAHLIYAVPADGNLKQRTQFFHTEEEIVTIIFQTNVQPEFQPCWLMVPLTGTKPVVGRFEYQLAYADWRFEGSTVPNIFAGHVTSVIRQSDRLSFILPFRAVSFTVGQSIATANGQVVNAAITSNQSTVGLKQFTLSDETGIATPGSSQLFMPGPMCGEFTASGFNENGVNFGFEAPFLVSQQESDNSSALRISGTYQVVAVAEVMDEDGDRIFSIVSPPLNFQLTGDNNSATYGIRMLQPLNTAGNPVAKHFGVTNRRLVGIALYRTAYQGDTPTTDHHKITLDLSANGLAPISDTNDSGFSFPSEFTANYIDENLDAAIINNEILYTDKGFLPRFPLPAQRSGDFWKERTWVVGYDGAIWMSAEKKEGDATWGFPLWRVFLPTTDKPVNVAKLDDFLVIGCEHSMWYLPAANFPNATGREGGIPNPVQLPFTNGCTGHMVTLKQGVAYSSTDGGVWMVTRSLTNEWFSRAVQDTLGSLPITSMTIDKHQRLFVATGAGALAVYDQIIEMWYNRWNVPTSDAHYLATLNGEIAFQEPTFVWLYDTSIFYDVISGSKIGIPLDVTFSSFNFGGVRSVKSLWEMQIVGDYKGPHHLNAVISYPDDDPDNPTVFPDPNVGPYTPDPDLPYLMAINPAIEPASSYGLRVFTDFTDIASEDLGEACEIELISCEVGVDTSTGLNKMRDSQRITGL